jgi:hypothetical protein
MRIAQERDPMAVASSGLLSMSTHRGGRNGARDPLSTRIAGWIAPQARLF